MINISSRYSSYSIIHDDIFDRTRSNNQDRKIMWNFISNEPNENESNSEDTYIHDENIKKKRRNTTKYSTEHTLQRKRQKWLTIGTNHLMNSS